MCMEHLRRSLKKLPRTISRLYPFALIGAYFVLISLPIAFAARQGLSGGNLSDLSSGLAMVALSMALAQFLLSGRIRSLSGTISIDAIMRFHQLAGGILFALVVAHPFLFAILRAKPNLANALNALGFMFSSQRLLTGVGAWCLVILLALLVVFRDRLRIPYEAWRLTHGLGAAAIATAGVHHALRVGAYSHDPWLFAYWVALVSVALVSLFQLYCITPLRQLRSPYRVTSNRQVAERLWEISVSPEVGKPLAFSAGQFVWLKIGRSLFNMDEHPFSIASAPAEPQCLRFLIKEAGDFTRRIGKIPVGARTYLDGPYGRFTFSGRQLRTIVFIAGGVGFAPIMSMLRQLAAERYSNEIHLIYGNRTEAQILHKDEIENLQNTLDLKVHFVLSEPPPDWTGSVGELSPEVIRGCVDASDSDASYFVCGPTLMMRGVARALADLGVPSRQIISEQFRYE